MNKQRQIRILIFIAFICFPLVMICQDKFTDNLKISSHYQYGVILPEYQFISYLTKDYVQAIDLSISKKTSGNSYWESLYNYPEYGISLFYSSLGNNEILGKELAINYFFKTPIITRNNFMVFNQTGVGFSYANKIFDLENNYLNVAVASHFNIHFNFRLGTAYMISKRSSAHFGISFDHFSNGNISEPNLGINYATLYGGLSWFIKDPVPNKEAVLPENLKKNRLEIFSSIGGKRTRALASDYFLCSSFSIEYTKEFFRAFHLGIGGDFFYDASVESQLVKFEKTYQQSDQFQTGIHLSQELRYYKASLIIQEGLYLFLPNKLNNKRLYNRGTIKYRINERISVRLSMLSYLFILNNPEIGIGVKIL